MKLEFISKYFIDKIVIENCNSSLKDKIDRKRHNKYSWLREIVDALDRLCISFFLT